MAHGDVIECGNWRATHKYVDDHRYVMGNVVKTIPPYWVWRMEIQEVETGEYFWPDCSWFCVHCGICLGCLSHLLMDRDGNFDEDAVRCSDSPTGWHVPTDDEDEDGQR